MLASTPAESESKVTMDRGVAMKRSRAVLDMTVERMTFAVALVTILVLAGCNDYGNTFQAPTGAQINFLSPSDASAGGADFTLTVTSSFGGFVAQTVVQWNGKTIAS